MIIIIYYLIIVINYNNGKHIYNNEVIEIYIINLFNLDKLPIL